MSFLLYGNTLKGEFVWDDVFFTNNPSLKDPAYLTELWLEPVLPDSPATGLYRPLTMFTFALNLLADEKDPSGFHAVNIILNGLVSFLIFLLVFSLFKNKKLAFFSAVFFALLPIHTEAVALIKSRDELLSALFAVLAWLLFIKASPEKTRLRLGWLGLSAGFFFLGMLSKEFTVVVPALFFLVHWIQKGRPPLKRLWRDLGWGLLFYGGFFLLYLWMRQTALPGTIFGNDDIAPLSNILVVAPWWPGGLLTPLKIAYLYISKIFVPIGLTASYHFKAVTLVLNLFYSWRGLLGLSFLGILIWLASWRKTRATAVGIGSLTFLILYLPASQFILRGGDIMGERWMYLPSLGMAMIAGWFFTYLHSRSKVIAITLFIAIGIFYSAVTIPRNLVWQTPRALFESMLYDSPKSVRGYSAMAQYYFENGRFVESKEMIDKGLAITNQEPNLYVVAASIAYRQKQFDLAEEFIKKALALETFSSAAILNYPRILFSQGKYEEAQLWFDHFLVQLPASLIKFQERLLYATILTKLGSYEESLIYIQQNLVDKASHPDVKKLIAVNFYRAGNQKEAFKYLDASLSPEEKIAILEKF